MFRSVCDSCLLLITAVLLGACFPWLHRVEVQQGNILSEEQLEQLQTGMNKEQVQFVLGQSVLQNAFGDDQWNYYFSIRDSRGDTRTYLVLVHFVREQYSHYKVEKEIFPVIP